MNRQIIIVAPLLISACATSMTPIEVNNTLPNLTRSKFFSQVQANKAVKSNVCKLLVKERNYAAPLGLTVSEDLSNSAKGIDEWVNIDRGNAYVLNDYKWVTIDNQGATQLYIKFGTMLCK